MELKDLKAAIDKFFGDMTRSAKETRDGLLEMRDHIEMLVETLPAED